MHKRLLVPAFVTLLAAGCLSDVPDEPPSAATPSPAATQERSTPVPEPTAIERTPTPAVTPRKTPDATPRPVGTPQGTTGMETGDGAARYDAGCLAGDGPDEPLASPPRLHPSQDVPEYPGPYDPIPLVPDKALQARLDAAVGDRADAYAFYVKDLSTGRAATHNGDRTFNAASLFKLFVMYGVFHQVSLDVIDWQDELVVTPHYDGFALSPRVTALCQVITIADAMDAMLSVSDNAAAVLLQDIAGSSNINAAIEALGVQDSGLFEDGLPVTANDLALLMEAIATGEAISPSASADMVRLLGNDVFENGLMGGVPDGTVVARKTGNWSDATHVAGIVYAPSGPYVFVALTSNGYETSVIEAMSAAAYEQFEAASER